MSWLVDMAIILTATLALWIVHLYLHATRGGRP